MNPQSTSAFDPLAHAFETLAPDNAALLLVDHQTGTMNFGLSDIDPVNLQNNVMWLAQSAVSFGLPIVVTTSNAEGANGPIFPQLLEVVPDAPVIARMKINAWHDEAFVEAVRATGRRKLIIAGVTADVCLTFPALGAVKDGYDVYAVLDASGTVNAHALQAAIARMSAVGVKIANTNMIVAELQADWSLPTAKATGQLYAQYMPNFGHINAQLEQATAS